MNVDNSTKKRISWGENTTKEIDREGKGKPVKKKEKKPKNKPKNKLTPDEENQIAKELYEEFVQGKDNKSKSK